MRIPVLVDELRIDQFRDGLFTKLNEPDVVASEVRLPNQQLPQVAGRVRSRLVVNLPRHNIAQLAYISNSMVTNLNGCPIHTGKMPVAHPIGQPFICALGG